MKIAVSGKGGVGKTTISAMLVKLMSQVYDRVYAIDADPDACLAAAVGISEQMIADHKPIIELKEVIDGKNAGGGAMICLNPKVDDVLDEYSITVDNIRFLRMGGLKKGGEACYCKENSFLKSIVDSLILDQDDVVVLDMGAGIEHLSRGTARGVDLMLVVVEPSKNSVNTAKNVQRMAQELGIAKVKIVGNKIRQAKEKDFIINNLHADDVLGFVPFDDEVWDNAMNDGTATTIGGVILKSMTEIFTQIKKEVGESERIRARVN